MKPGKIIKDYFLILLSSSIILSALIILGIPLNRLAPLNFSPTPTPILPSDRQPVVLNSPAVLASDEGMSLFGIVEPGWMFEGQFNVKLVDLNGIEIASAVAKETEPGSWQSGNPVPFRADFIYSHYTNPNRDADLIFLADNPYGLPENEKKYKTGILVPELIVDINSYCPQNGWVDCMPGPELATKSLCQPYFLNWAKINCPGFQGAAL